MALCTLVEASEPQVMRKHLYFSKRKLVFQNERERRRYKIVELWCKLQQANERITSKTPTLRLLL